LTGLTDLIGGKKQREKRNERSEWAIDIMKKEENPMVLSSGVVTTGRNCKKFNLRF
jgi:hypothetical protein